MAHANGHAIIADALAAGASAPALGEQRGLAIAGQSPSEVIRPRHTGRPAGRRNYRTEQMVGYLASRGKLPAEMLHDVLRQGWRKLATDLQISKREAFEIWQNLNLALMPYTAPKLAQLEIAATTGDGAGALGAGALHLLAAQTMAGVLAATAPAAPLSKFGADAQPIETTPLFEGLPAGLPDDRPLE